MADSNNSHSNPDSIIESLATATSGQDYDISRSLTENTIIIIPKASSQQIQLNSGDAQTITVEANDSTTSPALAPSNIVVTQTDTSPTADQGTAVKRTQHMPKELQLTLDPNKQTSDQKTLTLPPVSFTSLKTKHMCIEIDVDSTLNVSALEKIKLSSGKLRYYFKISKVGIKCEPVMRGRKRQTRAQKPDGTLDIPDEADEPASKKQKQVVDCTNEVDSKEAESDGEENEAVGKGLLQESNSEMGTQEEESQDNEEAEYNEEGEFGDDVGDDDDDFLEEVAKLEDDNADSDYDEKPKPKKQSKAKKTKAGKKPGKAKKSAKQRQVSPKTPKADDGDDGTPKRIYIKTNAYAKNDNYKVVKIDGKRMYECNMCGWQTKYIVSVKDHVRVHLNEKPFICGVCSKAFSNQSNLNSHLARHYDNRPYSCDVCELSFKLKSSLNSHKKRHYDEKKYECDVCGKKVFTKSSLKQHQVSHTDARPFQCNVCSKSFKTAPLLARHAYVHTGGGKYLCYVCNETFVRKEYWRLHMKKRHNENMEHEKRKRVVGEEEMKVEVVSIQEAVVTEPEETEYTEMEEYEEGMEYTEAQYQQAGEFPQGAQVQHITVQYEDGQQFEHGDLAVEGVQYAEIVTDQEVVAQLGAQQETNAQGEALDQDRQAQVEYLVNLQYEYVK